MSASRLLPLLFVFLVIAASPSEAQKRNVGAHFSEESPFRDGSTTEPDRVDLKRGREQVETGAPGMRNRSVLGTFGQETPLRTAKEEPEGTAVTSLEYREYLHILETRCILCHDSQRIDEAIERQLPFRTMEEIMRKRQVILTPPEREVMKTFWGTPLK